MIQLLKNIFGKGSNTLLKNLMQEGAQIIDVRTPAEFRSGHIKGAQNIPLQVLESQLKKIKKDKPVITCCASGMRSASAANILKSQGFTRVHNGGGWMRLQHKLN